MNTTFRRTFLQSGLGAAAALGVDATVPRAWASLAGAAATAGDSRVLVVVQLSGGNDGLNTIIPYDDSEYTKARPRLAIPTAEQIRVDAQHAFHPELRGFADLLEEGKFSVVHGVGYERPNRSHFESMDIWHTCRRKTERREEGWLGRVLSQRQASAQVDSSRDVPGIHFGRNKQPLALASRELRIPSVRSIEEFRLKSRTNEEFQELVESLTQLSNESGVASASATPANDLLQFVQSNATSALVASKQVAEAIAAYKTDVAYPDSELGKKLSVVAQLIDSGLSTSVYYVELDGFDTHAEQRGTHALLLREWCQAVTAFVNDVDQHGHGDRVSVMSFSEFGRRVAENASTGTDHGAAAPMYFAGGGLQTAFVGEQPSLTDLQDGDLKFKFDFRRVYSSVIRDWMQCEIEPGLDDQWQPLPIYA